MYLKICDDCGHTFDVTRQVLNSQSLNPARRLPARHRLDDGYFHDWHTDIGKNCECCNKCK